jgi:5,10-methylenetetrahydromethanopterin reductase
VMAKLEISCGFAPGPHTPEQVRLAEDLGYERAWFFDSPALYQDIWVTMALAAERTERIGLGPGVLVPSLRHPMVNAAATAALEALAPGRVVIAFGTGYSGRKAMGVKGPVKWAYMDAYIRAFKGLLRGETVEWEGARMRMLHPDGHAAPRPVEVPVLVAAQGPKGYAVAKDLADGLFTVAAVPDFAKEFPWVPHLVWVTVLEDGESVEDVRVRGAAGPGLMQSYHGAYEYGVPLSNLPGGSEWLAVVEQTPEHERHLFVHDRHCIELNPADQAAWETGAHGLLKNLTLSGRPSEIRERIAALAEQGSTEIVYQPTGPNVRRELEAFMDAASDAKIAP